MPVSTTIIITSIIGAATGVGGAASSAKNRGKSEDPESSNFDWRGKRCHFDSWINCLFKKEQKMTIKENQALTPEKKGFLVDQVQQEILLIADSIKQRKYGSAAFLVLQNVQQSLQDTLNKLLEKKGIITPSETSKALEQINKSKKARLEEEYVMGIRKSTFYLLSFGIIAVATFLIIKNKK